MKKRVAQWIGAVTISALAVVIYLLLFQTHLFSNLVLNSLNKYVFNPYSLSIQGQLRGGLMAKSIGISDLELQLKNKPDTLFTARELTLAGVGWNWNSRDLVIESLRLDSYALDLKILDSLKQPNSEQPIRNQVIIRNIKADDGFLKLKIRDSLQTMAIIALTGDLWSIDGYTGVRISASKIRAPFLTQDTLQLRGLLGIDAAGVVDLEDLEIEANSLSMTANARLRGDTLTAQFDGCRISSTFLNGLNLPEKYADLELFFDADLLLADNAVEVSGPGFIYLHDTTIPFELASFSRNANGESLTLTVGTELMNLSITAQKDSLGRLNGTANIFRLDVNPFLQLPQVQLNEPIGKFIISGQNGNYSIRTRLESFMLNDLRFDSLNVDLTYDSSGTVTIAAGLLKQSDNYLQLEGSFSPDLLNLHGRLTLSEYSFLQQIEISDRIHGRIESEFRIAGTPEKPHVSAELKPTDLGYGAMINLSGLAKTDLKISDDGLQGKFALQGNQGMLMGDSLVLYALLVNMSDGAYEIEDLHFQGQQNLISFSGNFSQQQIDLNKLRVIMGQNQLTLVDSMTIQKTLEDKYQIPGSVLTFNRGGIAIQGIYDQENGLDLNLDYDLINLGQISEFLNIKTSFTGLASGQAQVIGSLTDPVVQAQLLLTNGLTLGYSSDSARVDIILRSNTVISNSIEAYQANGSLTLIGQLPWGYKMRGTEYSEANQNFSINLDNYRLKDLKFHSIVGMPISGRVTGSLSIRGTPVDTKLDGQIGVVDANFDTLKFTSAYTDFNYEGNLLTFD
ncbi:MAG: hypothetical protein L3J79_02320, partial [Candidatus Marinimicrobia bacterium]|nr:hypothetical protein [Candidatus Neomarinimicrobiota bacterium]